MRLFVTGASGWIGSAVVPELLGAGHRVVGLARSEESAAALTAAGAEVRHGTLDDLDVLAATAAGSDGVIHLAFKHELAFSGDFEAAPTADRAAVETIGDALAGTDRPFVIASGCSASPPGAGHRGRREGSGGVPAPPGGGPSRHAAFTSRSRPAASGHPSCACPRRSTATATTASWPTSSAWPATGVSGYVDDGTNRWPAVHRPTPPACSGWPWKGRRRGRSCTGWPRRACAGPPSPPPSGPTSDCRWSRSGRTTSSGWAVSQPGQPRLERRHPPAPGLGPDRSRPPRRSRR